MRAAASLALLGLIACDGGDGASLGEHNLCNTGQSCGPGATCLAGQCIDDGSLVLGDSCNDQTQCGLGLLCHHFICKLGCTDVYYLDDCADPTWCKPIPGATVDTADGPAPAGSCVPSECDPQAGERCQDGSACVAVAPHIGACLPYCAYGFIGDRYIDACEDSFTTDFACQPLGENRIPVCMEAGGDGAPGVGEPGCDGVRNACQAGSICVNVVCRGLCTPAQPSPCPAGERCTPLGERTDIAYCRAD